MHGEVYLEPSLLGPGRSFHAWPPTGWGVHPSQDGVVSREEFMFGMMEREPANRVDPVGAGTGRGRGLSWWS